MIFDMPPVAPIEIYDVAYRKSVHVVSSCEVDRENSITLFFDPETATFDVIMRHTIKKALNTPGIVRVQICRKQAD